MTTENAEQPATLMSVTLQTGSRDHTLPSESPTTLLRQELEAICYFCGHQFYLHREVFQNDGRGCNLAPCKCRWFVFQNGRRELKR